jgi:hypothetical protein
MLLPSALSYDPSHQTAQAHPQSSLASPPTSPPPSTLDSLFTTCRTLQSMLSPPPQPRQQLTPPMSHAPHPSHLKLRLRARHTVQVDSDSTSPRMRVAKRQPPRGANKRRRIEESDIEDDEGNHYTHEASSPSTPKRQCIAPSVLPLGLERSDFHDLHLKNLEAQDDEDENGDEGEWTTEDDRILLELILEKLRLSKGEWQDCARSLGRDRSSVSRRWKTLVGAGDIGVKRRGTGAVGMRRGNIAGTWR